MKRNPVLDEDRHSIADWYVSWAKLVANVDFRRARAMFTEDVVGFGSRVEVVASLDALERDQWRSVWPTIEDYRYDVSTLEAVVSPDRLMAMGAVIFRSTGIHPDGTRFARTGRATATLMRTAVDQPWLATHTHISLKPGMPPTSHGNRPEAVA